MWIDTHSHFDADIFATSRRKDWQRAQSSGVSAQFMMGIHPDNWQSLVALADGFAGCYFALGIHPLFVEPLALDTAMAALQAAVATYRHHPRFIGIGEVGLDGLVKNLDCKQQIDFFKAQLRLAKDYDLPVFLHIRKAQDQVLKYCRQFAVTMGIAHAFNGSQQQAEHYMDNGFKLGFGGAMTYPQAKKLQRLAKTLPLTALVLETDSPYMAPAWIQHRVQHQIQHQAQHQAQTRINHSYELPQIGAYLSQLRGISPNTLAEQLRINTQGFLPGS